MVSINFISLIIFKFKYVETEKYYKKNIQYVEDRLYNCKAFITPRSVTTTLAWESREPNIACVSVNNISNVFQKHNLKI